jgi:hypothetical protein
MNDSTSKNAHEERQGTWADPGALAAARRTRIENLPAVGSGLSDDQLRQVSGGAFFGSFSWWLAGGPDGGKQPTHYPTCDEPYVCHADSD